MTSAPKRAWEFSAVRTASTRPVLRSSNCVDQRGGSQVHRHAQAGARLERKGRLIHQDGGVPLAQLDDQIVLERALAGEAPALAKFLRAQALALRVIDGRMPFQHVHAAAAATALPAAGEFYTLGEKQVAQSGSRRRGQLRLHGPEGDAVCGFVGHALEKLGVRS